MSVPELISSSAAGRSVPLGVAATKSLPPPSLLPATPCIVKADCKVPWHTDGNDIHQDLEHHQKFNSCTSFNLFCDHV